MYACMWPLLSLFFLLEDYIVFEHLYAHLFFGLESTVSKKLPFATSGLLLYFSRVSWEVETRSTPYILWHSKNRPFFSFACDIYEDLEND